MESIATGWMWAGFIVFVLAMLVLDMFVLGGRGAHKVSVKEALGWSVAWISLALLFNLGLWWYLDGQAGREVANEKALEFLTGYLIEKSLSVDNIFVFLMIFGYFSVPAEYQRRVLLYGVLGAIALRAAMILLGVWLVTMFHWVLYLFGAFLVVTGVKMFLFAEHKPDLEKNPVLRWMRGHLKLTAGFEGEQFFVVREGVRYATPLFLVLVLVEMSDLVFALDSIPAIFAVTEDPFIVFTSNIFAILGLRALYFLLADVAERFHLLKYGLALVLIFVGTKMLIVDWFKIPVGVALGVVAAIIATAMILSIAVSRERR
ncbi:MAG: TerC family protein [Gammaproteobacteria bacterium]|nr:TerC family protein [Gammaproteobacteria bacterium]